MLQGAWGPGPLAYFVEEKTMVQDKNGSAKAMQPAGGCASNLSPEDGNLEGGHFPSHCNLSKPHPGHLTNTGVADGGLLNLCKTPNARSLPQETPPAGL